MIPENWSEAPLRELLAALQSGSRPRGGVKGIESGVPSLGGEHLNALGGFNFSKIRFVPEAFAERMNAGQIQPHDTLIVKDGATTGKTSYVGEDFPHPRAFVNEHVFICRPSPEINSRYLFWFLFSKEGNERIMENFQGSAQGGINTTFAANVLVPLAPLNEQQRIVEKLDELMGRLAAAREKMERVPRLLSHFRRAVLSAACSGALTRDWREKNEDIDEWPEYQMRDLVKVSSGEAFKKSEYSNEGARLLQIANVSFSQVIWEQENFLPLSYLQSHPQLVLKEGDIVMALNRPLLNWRFKVARVTKNDLPAILYQRVGRFHKIKSAPEIDWGFLFVFLQSWEFIQELNGKLRGSDQPYINPPEMLTSPISLPPLPEQLEIVRRVNELFALADLLEARFNAAKAFFDRLPAAILAKAFRGELVPQDESDESADALLDRLRDALTTGPKATRKPRAKAEKQGSLF